MFKNIMNIGMILLLSAIVPAIIATLLKMTEDIKNNYLRMLIQNVLINVDSVFFDKDGQTKFIHTKNIAKNIALENTKGLNGLIVRNIVNNDSKLDSIVQNTFSNYKLEKKQKELDNYSWKGQVTAGLDYVNDLEGNDEIRAGVGATLNF